MLASVLQIVFVFGVFVASYFVFKWVYEVMQ